MEAIAVRGDITRQTDIVQLFVTVKEWRGRLDVLVLNASGGLERDLLALDPDYPMHINRDAQLALVESALPLMPPGSVLVFVTSHWAHLYGQIEQIPHYAPIAETKYAGEQALRAQEHMFSQRGIRLLVVTGDLIEGTITPRLLERRAPGLTLQRREQIGQLPTATDMGEAIANAATNPALPSGHTVVVGGSLEVARG
jgi:NAD(P)-dependent dehydrogenase (short-subunit alcohol dehydrogenase family)